MSSRMHFDVNLKKCKIFFMTMTPVWPGISHIKGVVLVVSISYVEFLKYRMTDSKSFHLISRTARFIARTLEVVEICILCTLGLSN